MTPFYDWYSGDIIGYKYRKGGWAPTQGKKDTWWATGSKRSLWGVHLVSHGSKTANVYLCEGETDAMAMHQWLDDTSSEPYYVFALAGKPSEELWGEWLSQISQLTGDEYSLHLCFDNDADGDEYTRYVDRHYQGKRCALQLGDFKDVAEMLLEADYKTVLQWEPLPRIPPTIKSAKSVTQRMRDRGQAFEPGLPLGFRRLDSMCSGHYPGSFIMVTAGSKAGKSSFCNQLVVNAIKQHDMKVLFAPLEMTVDETQALLGACLMGVDPGEVDDIELIDAADSIADKLYWVEHMGRITEEHLDEWFHFMDSVGVKLFVVDPIQASTSSSDEGVGATLQLDKLLYGISQRGIKYGISTLCVSHSNDAESSARISANQLRGSRALIQVPTTIMGVQRVDDGFSKVYLISPDRRSGKMGEVTLTYERHQFHEHTATKEVML